MSLIVNNPYTLNASIISNCKERLRTFLPNFLEYAKEELKSYDIFEENHLYYSYALQYNLQGGKLIRGLLLVVTVCTLSRGNMSEHLWNLTLTMAWCIELLQSSFLVADDVMDQSKMRRSNICWYLVPTIGIANAINDTMFLYTLIYRIILNVFKDHHNLVEFINTFNRVSMTTILGQHMDTYTSKQRSLFDKGSNINDLFNRICKNKTSYYTFYLPFKLGMLLTEMNITNLHFEKIENISIKMGVYFQSHDDYIDCYGSINESGKDGTDIQTGKCTWLLTKALELSSDEQRQILMENLCKSDEASINIVKGIYEDLKINDLYTIYKSELIKEIKGDIDIIEHEGIRLILNWTMELLLN